VRGLSDPRRLDGRDLPDPHAPHARVVARADPLRPRSVRARARGGPAPHPLLDPLRRRAAPLPGAALRRAPGEGDRAPARAPLPLERRARLPDAGPAGAHLEAAGRAAGALRADLSARRAAGARSVLPASPRRGLTLGPG